MTLRFVLLALFSFLALLPNLGAFSLYMEESRRALISFEMESFGNIFQPTFLGEPYFNKPPLFNWMIMLSADLFGWGTLAPRAVTLFSLVLTYIFVVGFTFYVVRRADVSLLAGLMFVTFSDVLFWYGWLAEIDMAMTFLVFLLFITFYLYSKGQKAYIYASSIITALIFLLKGFPALVFFLLTSLSVFVYRRSWRSTLNVHLFLALILSLIILMSLIALSEYPMRYIEVLWKESFNRVEGSFSPVEFLKHLLLYPVLNLKQTLPYSAFFIFLLIKRKIKLGLIKDEDAICFLSIATAVNYLPYLLSAGSRGRYVLPLMPGLAVILAYLFYKSGILKMKKLEKVLIATVITVIILRGAYGAVFFPYMEKVRGEPQKVVREVYSMTLGSKVSCDCESARVLCLYLGFLRGEPLLKSKYMDSVDYIISCERMGNLRIVRDFRIDKRHVFLVEKGREGL